MIFKYTIFAFSTPLSILAVDVVAFYCQLRVQECPIYLCFLNKEAVKNFDPFQGQFTHLLRGLSLSTKDYV